jgi:endonuclease YncB( thermonuclease family)
MRLAATFIASLALVTGCLGGKLPHERRYDQKQLQQRLGAVEKPGLIIGEFALAQKNPVIDGDTIRVEGLDSSLRLLGLDAEETFKKEPEKRAYEMGWEQYKKAMRGDASRPAKYATPLGEDAKVWAKHFFAGASKVRLERDHPDEIRDYYERYLAYVFVEKNGKWLNFNVELVRAGYSPYFMKYGYSRRFHEEFVAAQKEAQALQVGIWDPKKEHYPDYPERLEWWGKRAEVLKRYEAEAEGQDDWVTLTAWDSIARLESYEGKEVTIIGAVSEIRMGDRGPTKVMLGRRRGGDFPLIFFDKDTFLASKISEHKGEFIKVRGYVSKYKDKRRGVEQLQIVVSLPGQIKAEP